MGRIEEVKELIEKSLAGVTAEHVTDEPDSGVVTFRIETPFYSFQIDQQIGIYAFYREEDNLIQFSDRGLYSFCVNDRSNINLKRHRNFVRASGYLIMSSESEEDSFVVNTPTIKLESEELDLNLLLSNYLSLLLFCGEV